MKILSKVIEKRKKIKVAILKYLYEKGTTPSAVEISKKHDLDIDEAIMIIGMLRGGQLVKATDGYGEGRYTNIKITHKGEAFLLNAPEAQ